MTHLGSVPGTYALNYISIFSKEEFYLISHHKRPTSRTGDIWGSLPISVWGCYGLTIIVMVVTMFFISINIREYINKSEIEPTEIFLRMAIGWLEPHCINWYKGFKSVKVLVICWLLIGITFNAFFNVDFRSSLMTQKFPEPVRIVFDVTNEEVFKCVAISSHNYTVYSNK